MDEHKAEFVDILTLDEARIAISAIGSDPKSIDIMAPKTVHKNIYLYDVAVQDAIIIKQDMLSLGGEVAIPKDAFYLDKKPVKILISGTILQLQELVMKLNRHYPRLQRISKEINDLLSQVK